MKICKHCNQEYNDKLLVCPYCLKSENDKVKRKKEIKEKNLKEDKEEEIIENKLNNFDKLEDSKENVSSEYVGKIKNKIKEFNKKGYFIYAISILIVLLLFLPIVEFVYVPDQDSIFDMKYFADNNIELKHNLNIIRLLFGYKIKSNVDGALRVWDTIKPNFLNLFLIALPVLLCIFKKKKFSFIFIILEIVFLYLTRIIFIRGMTSNETFKFNYEILYSVGFFIILILLLCFLAYDIYYIFGSEKDGNDL